jgi:signal transduction protein with GAF and PtsI domain
MTADTPLDIDNLYAGPVPDPADEIARLSAALAVVTAERDNYASLVQQQNDQAVSLALMMSDDQVIASAVHDYKSAEKAVATGYKARLNAAWAMIDCYKGERDTWMERYHLKKLDAQGVDDELRALKAKYDAALNVVEAARVLETSVRGSKLLNLRRCLRYYGEKDQSRVFDPEPRIAIWPPKLSCIWLARAVA